MLRRHRLALLCALWPLAVPAAATEHAAIAPAREAELETLLYQDCGSCHGMTLRGGLGPALPRDRMQALGADALSHVILHGIPGSAMPGWKALISEADARWLADHLQTDNRLETLEKD
ncbi:cytochrome c [Halomonas sp. M4R5S39]|uniref:c-type cytochrome n=1 Tax=Halomonas kalidii TaxID=3043293 RepID=UPI0024A7BBC3|nr:cytochrome c [Halomonas kalidii]MDI5987207.1 cytochrome c [Halomonas kalidii]